MGEGDVVVDAQVDLHQPSGAPIVAVGLGVEVALPADQIPQRGARNAVLGRDIGYEAFNAPGGFWRLWEGFYNGDIRLGVVDRGVYDV